MKIFTIENGEITDGAVVGTFSLKAGIKIPAIIVGQEGRGRQLGVLPVQLLPDSYKVWQEKGEVKIVSAEVGQTKAGKPKLFEKEESGTEGKVICVFNTQIGFRGGNSHTGDRTGEYRVDVWGDKIPSFHPFPGEWLTKGVIAQGDAGRMGSGEQGVAVVPKNVVFRTGYSGRLYGNPSAHYYLWDGEQLLVATWDERQIADLF